MYKKFYPRGICSREIDIELEDGVIKDVSFFGGCDGNHHGLCSLLRGQKASDAIEKLKGIKCGFKPTSCPDQLAIALEEALKVEST